MSEPAAPWRIVLVDDQAMMRAAFRMILTQAGMVIVGEAGDGDTAVRLARDAQPDVVLMDVRMPGRDGLSATAEITRRQPTVAVLVLTTFDDDDVLYGALRSGAAGFLLKNSTPEDLVAAVRRVAVGDAVLDPAVTARVLRRVREQPGLPAPGPSSSAAAGADAAVLRSLTEREREVFALVAQGCTNAEIAATLLVGEATAKTHVSRVLAKLGARDRVQAVIRAYELGFVTPPR